VPTVRYKGPDETDAKIFRRVADRLVNNYDIGGGNVRMAMSAVMRSIADAIDAKEDTHD
jgi:aspartyl-tRNA synthetase